MSTNVLEHLETKTTLKDKLLSNHELSSAVMGLLARAIYMAQVQRNTPVRGITIDGPYMTGSRITARMKFSQITQLGTGLWVPHSNFADYVGARNMKMAQALKDNPGLGNFFEELTGRLDSMAKWKGWRFEDMVITRNIITGDDVIVIDVGVKMS